MAVSYKKLFKLLIDRDMKRKDLLERTGISYSTLSKLANGDNVTMEVVERLCIALNCGIEDVVEIVPNISPVHRPIDQEKQGDTNGA